ncbi:MULTISPECIES: hypothetical protein [Deinococcus]|uniref:hypothetical protein n=1 Tax=Deinococcus TaxID=1298 RepID=UPI001666DBD0|nr:MULTISPECIES: hypothetical protein [Deinococcus]MDK2014546.1 hypothetical protein [Deinococcus sp. 43]GGB82223.1 hypothetical protein GCM10008019_43040 [Deinococcus soli (ex Cha et al. 2016)]
MTACFTVMSFEARALAAKARSEVCTPNLNIWPLSRTARQRLICALMTALLLGMGLIQPRVLELRA